MKLSDFVQRWDRLWILLASVVVPSISQAEVLFDQMTNFSTTIIPSSWMAPDGYDGDSYAWDNFLMPGDATIREVWWVGGGGTISGLTVRFYTGLAAAPDLQPTITALPEEEREGDYLAGYRFDGNGNQTAIPGSSLFQYHVVLPTQLNLPANTVFWIKIEGDAVGYPSWGVARATHGRDNRHFRFLTGAHMFFGMTGSEAFQLHGEYAGATISGHVQLQNYVGNVSSQVVEFMLLQGTNVETRTAILGADGTFSIQSQLRGQVEILARGSHWLWKRAPDTLNLTSAGLSDVDFSLVNGDCNADNEINLVDWGVLSASFGSAFGDPEFDPRADLDGDDEVALVDASIVSANFGQAGDM